VTISPWILLFCSIPILLLGEKLVEHISTLRRFNIPAPVVGGLVVAILLLVVNLLGLDIRIDGNTTNRTWNWMVSTHQELVAGKEKGIARLFLIGFFACIGLNASWSLVKKASWQLPLFLGLAGLLTVVQNLVGVSIATALHQSPLLGLLCGSVSLTGGHGTAIGFSEDMVNAGFAAAPVVGVASATFGLVAAGLLGGPVGGALIKKFSLRAAPQSTNMQTNATPESNSISNTDLHTDSASESGFLSDVRRFFGTSGDNISSASAILIHIALWLLAIKVGAYVSVAINEQEIMLPTFGFSDNSLPLTLPIYIGAMIVGITTRNLIDIVNPQAISTERIEQLSSICLGIFLTVAMMELNLLDLIDTALPMIVILSAQVLIMAFFARFITYYVMGKDYDAAVMAAGHCGFGLGATPAAVANMKAVAEQHGPAPRAFLIVPLVGCFFIDFINSMVINNFLGVFRN